MKGNQSKVRKFNVEFLPIVEKKLQHNKVVHVPINIANKIEDMSKCDVKSRIKSINGNPIRLQEVKRIEDIDGIDEYKNLDNNKNIWLLKFIKFKDSELFGIADEDGDFSEEKLEKLLADNEADTKEILDIEVEEEAATDKEQPQIHLASPTVCIFDGDRNLFVLARNQEGVSAAEILEFLSKVLSNNFLGFGYINKNEDFNGDDVEGYRSIEIGMKELSHLKKDRMYRLSKDTPSVYNIIKSVRELKFNSLSITGTMGDDKEHYLSDLVGSEAILLAASGLENLSRLKIGVIKKDEKKTRKVDFLQDRLVDEFNIRYNSKERVKSEVIEKELLKSYNNNYNKCK